jgi:hypothetical protein
MKFWKNWPYWVRGGIIGFMLMVLIIVTDYIFSCGFKTQGEFCGIFTITATTPLNIFLTGKLTTLSDILPTVEVSKTMYIIFSLVYYLLLGITVGWFYGKIKNRMTKLNDGH